MLDKTDLAELIEYEGFTAQYTIVDGVSRLVLGGRDEAGRELVDRIFVAIREDHEAPELASEDEVADLLAAKEG